MRFASFLLALTFFVPAAPAAESIDAAAVDAIVRDGLKSWQVPGAALAIVRGDEVVYLKAYGVREVGTDKAVTPDTLFAIASCSKAFTATAAGLLVDDGKMTWDDPVRKHLDWFHLSDPLADRDASIRDLLCHRTGLARHDFLGSGTDLGRDDIVRRMAHVRPAHPFRSAFEYNNNMYLAAGQAVGAASKGSWDEIVTKRLFEPLGMKGATCSAKEAGKDPEHALPHRRKKDGTVEVLPWHDYLDRIGPAGSIYASARDMARWLRFQLGDGTFEGQRVLKAETLAETHSPQVVVRLEGPVKVAYPDTLQLAYGLGWFVHDHRKHLAYSHTGGLEGFRARVVLLPKEKLGLVLLMNSGVGSSFASMHYVVSNSLLDLLLGLEKKDWDRHYTAGAKGLREAAEAAIRQRDRARHTDTKPSRDLAAYAGTYEDAAYGEAKVSLREGALWLEWGRSKIKLEHFHYDTFVARQEKPEGRDPLDNQLASFVLRADGEVGTLRLLGEEFRRVGK
ncbi:MAG TPA: serine hydrolase [Gemmataceae bacterium]|nr:serine hydrolase [Gemmataceae bacterium]